MNKLFEQLKDRAQELGVSPEALKKAIDEAKGDMSKILKFLTEQKTNTLNEGKETIWRTS